MLNFSVFTVEILLQKKNIRVIISAFAIDVSGK